MKPTDDERLRHMRDAAQEAVDLLGHRSSDEVSGDRPLALALVKLIEIIGEAATNVTREGRARVPLPWEIVVATRNRLIHGYHDINIAIVVATVREDLPVLIEILDRHLSHG
jgi:uncharacterized protein with HEPN domain